MYGWTIPKHIQRSNKVNFTIYIFTTNKSYFVKPTILHHLPFKCGEKELMNMSDKMFLFTFIVILYVFVELAQRQLTKQLSVCAREQTFGPLDPKCWHRGWKTMSKSSSQILSLSFHPLSLSLGQQAASAKHWAAWTGTGAVGSLSNCQMVCFYFSGLMRRLGISFCHFCTAWKCCRYNYLFSLPIQLKGLGGKKIKQGSEYYMKLLFCWQNSP